ncbi:MAG: PQQ-binding-like beta-propeller repeat protein [Planctomycetes bacterium]|nr:PQQ-binding-like beta-propeller repeat protein [Planctomycetota bacterium]
MNRRVAIIAGMVVLLGVGLVLFTAPISWRNVRADDGADFRGWTDSTGRFQIQAALVNVKDGAAVLERNSGETVSVPLTRLSPEDQKFVREELARRRAARDAESQVALQDGSSSSSDTDWPQWRGPNRDGIAHSTGLLDAWPEQGPPLLWQTRGLGGGYSSVAVVDGKIYTQGKRGPGVELLCLDAKDGRQLWSARVGGSSDPTGTPTYDGDLVFAEDNDGNLLAADAESGAEAWRKSFQRDFGAKRPGWGFSESPLVDGERLICTPGGPNAMLAALNKQTGEVIWTCAVPGGRGHGGAGYSSPVVSQGAGVKQYVQLTGKGVIGVRAGDGKLLWAYDRVSNGTANIPTPIISGDFVFCSSGYNTGAALLRIVGRGREATAQEVYFLEPQTFQNHHGGMVLVDGFVYAGHGHNNGFPICVDVKSGNVAWGGDRRGPGSGSAAVTFADGNLIYRYENGVVALVAATPREYRLKSQFRPVHQQGKSWAHPVVADGKLYLREQDVLMCYDLRR